MPDPQPSSTPAGGQPSTSFREVLPKRGLLFAEAQPQTVLCKPKLLPLKSVTLQRLESMQEEAKAKAKEQMREKMEEEAAEEARAKDANVVSESVSFE